MSLDDLRLFLQVACCRSMSQAALTLGISVPTIARRLDALERAAGLRLLLRTPRGLTLTDHGAQLVAHADGFLNETATLDRLLAGLRATPRNTVVRVSATEPVVSDLLAPRLPALLRQKGAPLVELRVENDIAAIALNDADIAVRLVQPDTGSLMTRRVATLTFGLYGTREAVAALADDIRTAAILSYDDRYGPIAERRWIEQAGLSRQVVARMSSTRGLIAAVSAGAGLALLPGALARKAGLLPVPITTLPAPPTRDVWLVWHKNVGRRASFRLVLDWMTHALTEATTAE